MPSAAADQSVPMCRLTDRMVLSGLVMAWRLATSPTSTSPSLNATTDGVVRAPSALATTTGSPPSSTAMTLLVVPRSIPTALAIPVSFVHAGAAPDDPAPPARPVGASQSIRLL